MLVTSSRRWVLMHELRGSAEPSFEEQVKRLSPCDLLLVEGFKHAPIPKLEVWRAETGEAMLHPNDPHIVAVASDAKVETKLPLLDLNDADAISQFILKKLALALIESGFPKLRVFRIPDLLGAASVLALLAVVSLFVIGG